MRFKTLDKLLIICSVLMVGAVLSVASYVSMADAVTFTYNPRVSTSVTADTTLTSAYEEVKVNTAAGNLTITLPTVNSMRSGFTSKSFKIVKTSDNNTVTITPATGDTIGNKPTYIIVSNGGYVTLVASTGNNWVVADESRRMTISNARAQTHATASSDNFTMTVGEMLGGYLIVDGGSGARTITLPTGEALIDAMPGTVQQGDSFNFILSNRDNDTLTLTGGLNFGTSGTMTIGADNSSAFKIIVDNATDSTYDNGTVYNRKQATIYRMSKF